MVVPAALRQKLEGLIEIRKARSTGTTVVLLDNRISKQETGDPDAIYCTLCETHGGLVFHKTLAHARDWLSHPEYWCPDCASIQ